MMADRHGMTIIPAYSLTYLSVEDDGLLQGMLVL